MSEGVSRLGSRSLPLQVRSLARCEPNPRCVISSRTFPSCGDSRFFAQAAFSASCSCHASISDRLQAIALGVIRSGGGNAPALTNRHIVVRLIPSSRSTSFTLNSCIARTSPVNSPTRGSLPPVP